MAFGIEKVEWCGYPTLKIFWRYVYSFWQNSRAWQMDGQTDKTDTAWRHRPHLHSIMRQNVVYEIVRVLLNIWYFSFIGKQEPQLSQRYRATLRVIEYFAKSLKVIWNNTVQEGVCKSLLLVFYWNCVCMSYVYDVFSIKEWRDLETGGRVVKDHRKWRRSIDHIRLSIDQPL